MSIKLVNQQVGVHCLSFPLAASTPSNCSLTHPLLHLSSMLSLSASLQMITLLQLLTTTTSFSVVYCHNIYLMHMLDLSQRCVLPFQPHL